MKIRDLLKPMLLFLCINACSKENSDTGDEVDLFSSRNKIISSIKSDDYDTYLTAFLDEAALYEIDFNYVFDGEITFYEDESPVEGWAWGRDRVE